jgi:hypothetical protein
VKEKVIKFVCKDDQNLDPPLGGAAAIELALGTDNYCAEFGGTEIKNVAGLTKRKRGAGLVRWQWRRPAAASSRRPARRRRPRSGPCCGGFRFGVFTSGVNEIAAY